MTSIRIPFSNFTKQSITDRCNKVSAEANEIVFKTCESMRAARLVYILNFLFAAIALAFCAFAIIALRAVWLTIGFLCLTAFFAAIAIKHYSSFKKKYGADFRAYKTDKETFERGIKKKHDICGDLAFYDKLITHSVPCVIIRNNGGGYFLSYMDRMKEVSMNASVSIVKEDVREPVLDFCNRRLFVPRTENLADEYVLICH